MTTLSSILGKVQPKTSPANGQTKVASAGTSSLDDAINNVLNEIGAVKTASTQETPSTALVKMAAEVAAVDHDAEIKHGHLVGRAMGAGFISELNDYSKVAAEMTNQKIAAEGITEEDLALLKLAKEEPQKFLALVQQHAGVSPTEKTAAQEQAELEKFAAQNPTEFEALVKQGYDETMGRLQKEAEAKFNEGYNAQVEEIHKLAAEHFAMGFDALNEAVAEATK